MIQGEKVAAAQRHTVRVRHELLHCIAPPDVLLTGQGAPAEQVRGAEGAAAQWGAGEPGADGGRAAAGAAHADARARPPGALLWRRRLLQQRPHRARADAAAAPAAQDTGRPCPGVPPCMRCRS